MIIISTYKKRKETIIYNFELSMSSKKNLQVTSCILVLKSAKNWYEKSENRKFLLFISSSFYSYQDGNERNRATMLQMRLNILARVPVDPVNPRDK